MVTTRRRAREEATASPSPAASPAPVAKADLPPRKKDRGIRSVSPPFSKMRLSSFFYALLFVAGTIAVWYAFRAASVAVGHVRGSVPASPGLGWLGFGGGGGGGRGRGKASVESRIEELAQALGVPAPELAGAIAGVVRERVPPASLASIASEARKTGGSQVVDRLVGAQKRGEGVVGGVGATFGKVVGMDDAPEGVV